MNTWKVITATLVIFVAGVVTGALVVWHSDRLNLTPQRRTLNGARPTMAGTPGVMRMELLRRMQRDLDLTPEQHQQIDQLLKESQERTRKLMEPITPQLHQEFQHTKEAFRQVLTPEQRVRFDEMLRRPRHPAPRPDTRGTNVTSSSPSGI
ncbi:MAG TPA: hypothetical protein VG167_19660 [Verrucomicrobiae bacterium]|nr:hypothetical protein [Verrucomicrobiae bacterium]